MESHQKTVIVAILAGGLSTRMKKDKASLLLDGRTLVDHTKAACRAAGLPQIIICKDLQPRCGPLGGIVTAFELHRTDAILFLSCDMPFVSKELLKKIIARSRKTNQALFYHNESRVGFPFLIRRKNLAVVRQQIANRAFSLQSLAAALTGQFLRLPQNRRWQLFNINTPSDMRTARSTYQEHAAELKNRAPVLTVENLVIRRGKTNILQNLFWQVGAREHWVILGANGSGKTSLLSALTGYLMPTAGSIELLGQIYGESDWRELRTKVGLVSSSIRQMMADPETALETVVSGKKAMIDLWGTPAANDIRRARIILDEIECAHLASRSWSVLSQGERQRILIGRALMADPKILILDEPCAGLDPVARKTFLNFIEQLGRSPGAPALILVTHHVEEITPVFKHALILREGKLVAAGPIKETLVSKTLSIAFDAPVKLTARSGNYQLEVKARPRRVL